MAPPRYVSPRLHANPALDFLSPSFDASRALAAGQAGTFQPPAPRVRPLETVARCVALFPDDAYEALTGHARPSPAHEGVAPAAAGAARAQRRPAGPGAGPSPHERPQKRLATGEDVGAKAPGTAGAGIESGAGAEAGAPKRLGPFDEIAELTKEGPYALLYRAFKSRARVRVVLRWQCGVRGACEGTLVAYDKHFNLLLLDAVEEYKQPELIQRSVGGGGGGGVAGVAGVAGEGEGSTPRTGWRRKLVHRTRTLEQVLVRGDSVVLVTDAK